MTMSKGVKPQRVEKVARVLQSFTVEELAQLVSLVPRIQKVNPAEKIGEPVTEYFRRELQIRRGGKPLAMDEPFIAGLTYREYLSLSKEAETIFWDELFAEEMMEIDNFEEYDVKPNAHISA